MKEQIFFQLLQRIQLVEHIFSDFCLRNTGFRCLAWGHQAIVPPAMMACGWPHFPRGWFYSHLSCAPGRGRGVKQMRAVGSKREKCSKRTTQGAAGTTLIMTAEDGAHQVHSPGQQRQKMQRWGVWRQPESEELVPWHRAGETLRWTLSGSFPPSFCFFNSSWFWRMQKKKKKKILDSFFNLDEASQEGC